MISPLSSCPPITKRSVRARGGATRKVVLATALLVVLGGSSWGIYAATTRKDTTSQSTLETYLVDETDFNISTTCNGELEAKRQIEIRSKLDNTSTIAWIIPEGTSVKKNEVLIRLNSDDLETRRIEAELQVENAKAAYSKAATELEVQLKENTSKIQAAQVKLDLAVLALEQWDKGDKKQKQEDNRRAIAKAVAEHERLKEKYEKSIGLNEKGFVSTDELKQDKLAFEESERELEKARLAQEIYDTYQIQMDGTQKKSDVDQATSELERTTQQADIELRSKDTARNTSKRQLDVQEQKLAKLVEAINNATLTAPAEGLVVYATSMERGRWGDSDGPLQIGRQVYPNQLLIVLPDTSEMVASVRIHESLQSRVKPGQTATVKIDAANSKTFEATIESIGILAESGGWRDPNLREYTVKMNIDNDGVALKPAMRCEAEIIMGQVENAIAVPIQAVFNEGMLRHVYLPVGSKYVRRPISVGRMSERFAEITAGLKAGERVLLREPSAAEVLDQPWDTQELTAAGYKTNDDGQIVRVGGDKGGSGSREGRARGDTNGGNRPPAGGPPAGGPNRAGKPPAGNPSTETPAAKPEAVAEKPEPKKEDVTTPAPPTPAAPATPTNDVKKQG